MLKAEIEIIFYKSESEQTSYSADKITSLTFMLDSNDYYIGFIDGQKNDKKYVFNCKYSLRFKFPSLIESNCNKYLTKWKYDNEVSICLGAKIIGEGRVISYSLIDD